MTATKLDLHLFTQIKQQNEDFLLIDHLGLTDFEVLQIVKEWYINKIGDILQNEDGKDLEEVIDDLLY